MGHTTKKLHVTKIRYVAKLLSFTSACQEGSETFFVLPGFACDFFNDGVVSKLCREICRFTFLVLIVILIVIVIELMSSQFSDSQYGRFSYGAACSESPPYLVDSPICVICEGAISERAVILVRGHIANCWSQFNPVGVGVSSAEKCRSRAVKMGSTKLATKLATKKITHKSRKGRFFRGGPV